MIALVLGLIMLGLTLVHERERRRLVLACLIFAALLALGCIPAINSVVLDHTSWYMARRLPLLFPFGIAFVFAWDTALKAGGSTATMVMRRSHEKIKALHFLSCLGVCAVALMLLLPSFKTWGLFHLYMLRTDAFDHHKFAFLEKELGQTVRGETILSDPTTSYFLRGMAGARVVTMIPGEGSPAIDYAERDRIALVGFQEGPGALGEVGVDGVVLALKSGVTGKFAVRTPAEIVATWRAQGWYIQSQTDEMILLRPLGSR